ncbi:MAG TPA: FmdB family zinc ribbon protein [Acidimicrobiales bacterium]|jgi:putative FmdB family regulatory protein
MPTYEYRCKDCGHEFETVQAFTDDALTECPSCQGTLRKVFGNVGITFKGSGFYKTDSRSGSSASGAGPKKDGESSSKDKAASSTSDSSSSSSSGSSDSGSGSGSSGASSSNDGGATKAPSKPASTTPA